MCLLSLPLRERGLKPRQRTIGIQEILVAPPAGARADRGVKLLLTARGALFYINEALNFFNQPQR